MKHSPYSRVRVSSTTPNRFRPSPGGTGIRFFKRFLLLEEEMCAFFFRLSSHVRLGIGGSLLQANVEDTGLLLFRDAPTVQSDILKCLKGTIGIAQIAKQSDHLVVECQCY